MTSPYSPRRARVWTVGALLLTAALTLAACGGSSSTPTTQAQASQSPVASAAPAAPSTQQPTASTQPTTAAPSQQPAGAQTAPAAPTPQPTAVVDRSKPAAVVNGENITFEQLDVLLEKRYGKQVLNELVTGMVIDQEAKKRNIQVTPAEIDAQLKQIQAAYPGQDIATVAQQQFGYDLAGLRNQIRISIEVEKMLEPQLKLTDKDLQEYYNANKQQFASPQEVKLQQVITDSEAKAKEASQALKSNTDIKTVVDKYGVKNPPAGLTNGSIDFTPVTQLTPEISMSVGALKAGGVSDPISLQSGVYAVVKVEATRGGDVPPFDKVKAQVRKASRDQQLSQVAPGFIDSLMKKSKIENQLEPKVQPEPPIIPGGQPQPPPVGTPQG